MSNRVVARARLCAVASAGLVGAAIAGPMSAPALNVNFYMNAEVLRFAPADPESYSLFATAGVSGFTVENHPDNRVRMMSNNGWFESETTPASSSATSAAFGTVIELTSAINDGMGWTMEIRDGATGALYDYMFDITAPTLSADHLRPVTVTNVSPGDVISSSPTFEWTIPEPSDPLAAYTGLVGIMVGPAFVASPPLVVGETSWSPAGPLPAGIYDLILVYQGFSIPDLLTPTAPTAVNGAPDLVGFSYSSEFSSYAQVAGLQVVPSPGAGALVGVAVAGMLVRRRR